jgi:phage repressor protein C with HTH and peptisase S24 domain
MFIDGEDKNGMTILTVVVDEDNNEKIVHVPIPAQAGYPSEFDNPDFIQDLPSFSLPDYKYKIGTHRSFDVAGDSMEPTLFEGDKVICSYVEPNLWEIAIKNNYVYIIVTKSDILVKRVHNLLKVEMNFC